MDNLPRNLKEGKCEYCSEQINLESLESFWIAQYHYKVVRCSCGKSNWVKVNFEGSGHDQGLEKKKETIESTIQKVFERSSGD